MAVSRFNFPIATAACARSLSSATSLRSTSSIFLRQSAMSMKSSSQPSVFSSQLFYKLTHCSCFAALISLDRFHNRAADYDGIGKLSHIGELSGRGNSEAESDGQLRYAAQALHQFARVFGQLLALSGNAGSRDRINKSARSFRDSLQ